MARVECNYHCRGCDAHFGSIRGFDKHRVDGKCVEPDWGQRKGTCRISDGKVRKDVEVHP